MKRRRSRALRCSLPKGQQSETALPGIGRSAFAGVSSHHSGLRVNHEEPGSNSTCLVSRLTGHVPISERFVLLSERHLSGFRVYQDLAAMRPLSTPFRG